MLANLNVTPKATSWLERDWTRYGAESSHSDKISLEQASTYCRELAENHYENFTIASRLVPSQLRRHFYHVYAFCRWSDDLADESSSSLVATERLAWWQQELNECFQGRSHHPVMVALQDTIEEFSLTQAPFDDLLSAFRQDQQRNRYTTDEQLLDYCRRSANPVGRILLKMARAETRENLVASDMICTGLQLVNFCQDMERDARRDRIYLPESRWQLYGITESVILARKATEGLQQAALAWCCEIAEYFFGGWVLANRVPPWLARDVRLFASAGLKVIDRILQANGDVWSKRVEVTKCDKLVLLARTWFTSTPPKRRAFPVSTKTPSSNRSVMGE